MTESQIRSLRDSLVEICSGFEVVLIDTSCCRGNYRSDLSREQTRKIREMFGRRGAKVPHDEEVFYLNMLINTVNRNHNIRTVREVIAEMEGGFRHFRHRTQQQNPYMAAATGLMSTLKERMIGFSGEEAYNFELVRKWIGSSGKAAGKYVREKDMSLAAVAATSAAYRGSTAVLSNDTNSLGIILSIPGEIGRIPGAKKPIYSLVPYSFLERDAFYPCKEASDLGLNGYRGTIPA